MTRPLLKLVPFALLAVVSGIALAGCGSSGGDTGSSATAAKPSRGYSNAHSIIQDSAKNGDFDVYMNLTVRAPKGTKLTFERTPNGNCAKGITNHEFTTGDRPWNPGGPVFLFTGTVGGSCNTERSAQQYKVTAKFPDGTSQFRLVNFEQPNISPTGRTVQSVCAYGNLACVGGSDTAGSSHPARPPLIID